MRRPAALERGALIDNRSRTESWPERLIVASDPATGLRAVIAIDDTTLGPALGGIRMRAYPSLDAAVEECRRLARAMTLKNALAETDFGGGKSVIASDGEQVDRVALFTAFAAAVQRVGRPYIPAADMGTSVADVEVVGAAGVDVGGGASDTEESTAVGVHAAIHAAVATLGIAGSLDGVSVAIQGVGKVGARLAQLLAADGARLRVCDVDAERAERCALATGATVVAPDAILDEECAVFSPCSAAGVIDARSAASLRCRAIVGAANEMLAQRGLEDVLAQRGIVYVPDFLTSAGGVIQVRAVRDAWPAERLHDALMGIGERTAAVIATAAERDTTPLAVAEAIASEKLRLTREAALAR